MFFCMTLQAAGGTGAATFPLRLLLHRVPRLGQSKVRMGSISLAFIKFLKLLIL